MRKLLIPGLILALLAACGGEPDTESVLRRGNGGDPGSLDPALAADEHAFNVIADLYEGLVVYGPDGAIRPGVAASWESSPDGLTWTFSLRNDARWSDGQPVTADDFVAGFTRVRDPATAAPLGFLLDGIALVAAPDASTLVIALHGPMPQLLSVLAMAIASPYRDGEPRPTNGPFLLESWRPGGPVRLAKNPAFHGAASVQLDAVEHHPVADPAAELNRFRAGELDLTMTVPPTSLEALRETHDEALHIAPRLAVYYVAPDLSEAPLDAPAMRQALSMAIDREALARLVGRGEQPAYGFVPNGLPGYDGARFGWAELAKNDRESEARRLFEKTGFEGPLRLLYDTGDIHEKVALAVASMWQDVLGLDVELDKREWQHFLATREQRDEWQLMRFAWTGDYAHPKTFLDLFLTGNPMNLPGYASAEFDRLMGEGSYAAAEARLLSDNAVIPLYFYVSKHLVSPEVSGFEANALDVHPSRYLRKTR